VDGAAREFGPESQNQASAGAPAVIKIAAEWTLARRTPPPMRPISPPPR
jgi:hypothetical protein